MARHRHHRLPTLPAHVQATDYGPETGRLDLRPDSPVYATQLRLLTPRIIATADEHTGVSAMRALRVLPPGAVDTTQPPATDRPTPGAAAAPAGEDQGDHIRRLPPRPRRTPRHRRPRPPTLRRTRAGDPSRIPSDARSAFDDYRAQARETASAVQDAAIRRARAKRAGQAGATRASALRQAG
ncbi:hypothetical protein [Streptomyces sp. NPDC000961]|uniref:hypothetical protein n=1 Tax=Streptomyces sp. NPDC000961 TaxID=3364541 RepID=UPI003694F580